MDQPSGHKLNYSGGIARCQCNAWQWSSYDPELPYVYAKHISDEKKREENLLRLSQEEQHHRSGVRSTIIQMVILFAVFAAIMFTTLHFIG